MINRERLVNSFMEFVAIDSESRNELKFGQRVLKELKDLGLSAEMDNAGAACGSNCGNIIGRLEGNRKGAEPIIFSCHLDTVSPGVGIKPTIKDGTIYSDGTTILGADDKAGIAAFLEAIRVVKEKNLPHGDIEVTFSIFEEGGLNGAKNLDYNRLTGKKIIVLDDGAIGKIIIQGPSQDKLKVTIHGKAAHAGAAPEEGISAISVAAQAISKMKLLKVDEETTANIGTIHGGIATNIVSPEVVITAEARSLVDAKLTAQTDHMVACFEEAAKEAGAKVIIERERMYSAFILDKDAEIVRKVEKAFAKVGVKTTATRTGGGSDTNIYNANGFEAVNLGIGGEKGHTLEEHIKIDDLAKISEGIVAIIEEFAG